MSAVDAELLPDPLATLEVAVQDGRVHPFGQVDHSQELDRAEPAESVDQRGARVAVMLDGSGFVRAIVPVDGVSPTGDTSADPTQDTLTIRQTCITAAAECCASRPELKSADLLAVAERMEAWVTR